MNVENIIKELFTSPEMSEYLIENIDDIPKCKILEMILKAQIDLRRKGEILLELSKDEINEHQYPLTQGDMTTDEYYDLELFLFNNSFKYNYDHLSKALSELEAKNGDIFSVQNFWHDYEWPNGCGESKFSFHSSFENAMRYICGDMYTEGWSIDDLKVTSWYEIKKWSLTEDGDYDDIVCFYLNGDKLTHFSYKFKYDLDYNSFEPDCHLNLITPFSTGDILTVNCRPQKPDKDILILENINNSDCCSLQCLFYDYKSKLFKTGAVKHASMYRGLSETHLSPLYRITRATESPIKQDKFLYKIQKFLNNDPKKGSEMWLWINDKRQHKRKTGVTLNEIRKYMEKKNHEQ